MAYMKKRRNEQRHEPHQARDREVHSPHVAQYVFVIALLSCILVSLPTAFAEYEENIREGIYVVEPANRYRSERTVPTLLQSEDLTFFACIEYEDTPVRLSVLCTDDNNFRDVDAVQWGPDNCFMGSVSLDTLPCQSAILTADYVRNGENQRLTKPIRINKITGTLQRLLDGQFTDGGWSSALDTAYALFSMKPFFTVFEDRIDAGLNYLKDNRDEDLKCWPEEQCQISTTSSIAYLLAQAEYSDESRILRDATTYLELTMNYISGGEIYTVTLIDHPTNLNNTVNTSCVYGYNTFDTAFELGRNPAQHNFTANPTYGDIIRAVCTENIIAHVTSNVRGRLITYAGDNFSYTIPGPCWTFNNENVTCDLRTTAFATGAPISADRKAAASQWLANQLTTGATGSMVPGGDIMDASLIAVSASGSGLGSDARTRLLNNLLFRQANQGNWNVTTHRYNGTYFEPDSVYRANYSHVLADTFTGSFIYTGFAVQALLTNDFDRDREEILDAERWASNNERAVSVVLTEEQAANAEIALAYEQNLTDILADPKRNAMALYTLQQNTRPFLKSEPRVIILDKQEITIDLTNPTTFALDGLTYSLPQNLQPYVWIEEKDTFAPFSFRRISLRQLQNATVNEFGYLRIMDGADEYAKIPIIVLTYPELAITIPREMTVFGTATIIPLNVTKSGHDFACRIAWNDGGITTMQTFTIEQGGLFNLPAQFTQSGTEQKDYRGTITCTAVSSTFTFPFTINVNRFLTRPISVTPSFIDIVGTDLNPGSAEFTVRNLLDETIDVVISLRDTTVDQVDFSEYFLSLYPSETRTVTVTPLPVAGDNVSIVNAIVIRSFNVEERIPLTIELIAETPVNRPLWLLIAVGVFSAGLIGILAYFGYENRAKITAWWKTRVNRESYYEKVRHDVHEYEAKEQALAIKNLTTILKMQGLSDVDIRKRLNAQGFTDEEITASLKMKIETATPATLGASGKGSEPKAPPPRT